jgi:polar amino acid transport system substrate-binding protein
MALLRKIPSASALCLCLALCVSSAFAAEPVTGQRRLIVGGDRNYPPYEFLDAHGEPAGFIVDVTRAVGEAVGVEMSFLLMDWARLHEALLSGRIDALQRIPSSKKWLNDTDLSPPSVVISHAVFAREGTPDISSLEELAGKKII